jgi:hypothetical protein
LIKHQGNSEYAKAKVLAIKQHGTAPPKAQVEVIESDIEEHPKGTKLMREFCDMRAIEEDTEFNDGDEEEEQASAKQDSSSPEPKPTDDHRTPKPTETHPKHHAKKSPLKKGSSISPQERKRASNQQRKEQQLQRKRPSVIDRGDKDDDDDMDDDGNTFAKEMLDSRDLDNLDEFQQITKQMVMFFVSVVFRSCLLTICTSQITQAVKVWLMDSRGIPFVNPEHKVSSSSMSLSQCSCRQLCCEVSGLARISIFV